MTDIEHSGFSELDRLLELVRRTRGVLDTLILDGSLSADIRATIQPDEPLPSSLAGQPVEVSVDRGPSLDWLIDRALAAGF